MITARIKLEAPRETVVLVADTRRAVDNIIEALREDGVYADHSFIGGGLDGDDLVHDRGGWISGPCMDTGSPQ